MLSNLLRLAAVVLGSVLSPLAASTLTVGPPGSGAGFSDIQPAIDAAQPGDTILVLPGSYTSFKLTKPLDLLGAGSGVVQVGSPVQAPIMVSGIPAGSEAVLSGFRVSDHPSIKLFASAGSVTLHDVVLLGGFDLSSGCEPGAGLFVSGCARVMVLSSTVRGMSGVAGDGLQAQFSEVWLIDSQVDGGDGAPWGSGCTTQGGLGASLIGSALYLAGSSVRGGFTQSIPFTPLVVTNGIAASGGSMLKIVGGSGAKIEVGGGLGSFFPVSAILLSTSSSLLLQAQVPVVSYPGAPPFSTDGSSAGTVTPTIYPTLLASAQQTSLGSALSLQVIGDPGASALFAYSPATGPSAFFAGIDGGLALDLASTLVLAALPIGPSGGATLNLTVPSLPGLVGTTALFQALELGAPLQDAFSNPTLVTVL